MSDVLQLPGDLDPVVIQDLRSPWQAQETTRLGSGDTARVHNWTQHLTSVPSDDTLLQAFQANSGLQGKLEPNTIHGTAPLTSRELPVDVHVQGDDDDHGSRSPDAVHGEHNAETN